MSWFRRPRSHGWGPRLTLGIASVSLLWAIGWYEETHVVFEVNSGMLADYRLVGQPLPVGKGARQCSGLTFDEEHQHLFAVIGAPPGLIELDLQGQELRRISLVGFQDTEGVAYLGDGRFAVVEERRGVVDFFSLDEHSERVDKASVKSLRILPEPGSNRGLEGIAYARDQQLLFFIKERLPRRLIRMPYPPPSTGEVPLSDPWDMEERPWWGLRSLSDLYYDQLTQHLLVLSARSKAVVEFTLGGEEVGRLSLKAGSAGLKRPAWSAEGITMSPDRTLYICGEENELFVFKPHAVNRTSLPKVFEQTSSPTPDQVGEPPRFSLLLLESRDFYSLTFGQPAFLIG